MAAIGAATENQELVLDELAAAVSEDRRTAGQARPVLLVAPVREPSDAAAVCQHAGADKWAVASVGIAKVVAAGKSIWSHQGRRGV